MAEETDDKAMKETEVAEEVSEEITIQKGDFVLVELTGRVEETGEVFETTDAEAARSAGIYKEDGVYGPRVVVVGEGWVLKGLDQGLPGLKLGEDAKVEVKPTDAFGERDPEKIRIVRYRVLRSKGIDPRFGAQVEFEGRPAVVRSIGAGRVQLDYNHPLAGRELVYDVKVSKMFETEEEKIRALIQRRITGIDPEKFRLRVTKNKVRIEIPEEVLYTENLQFVKRGIALDIMRFLPKMEVSFREVFKKERSSG